MCVVLLLAARLLYRISVGIANECNLYQEQQQLRLQIEALQSDGPSTSLRPNKDAILVPREQFEEMRRAALDGAVSLSQARNLQKEYDRLAEELVRVKSPFDKNLFKESKKDK